MATSLTVRCAKPIKLIFRRPSGKSGQRTVFNHLHSANFLSIFSGRKIPLQPGAREALPPGKLLLRFQFE
jgi:hypothetical protein